MKYISFAIPSYNSQEYMAHAIESILPGGDDVEIIIVNDGSKDRTSEIGHEYAPCLTVSNRIPKNMQSDS